METEIKTYPIKQIKDFFNQNKDHIPRESFWINEHTQYHNLINSIRTYINIIESDQFDKVAKESAFDKLKSIKMFITLYKEKPEPYDKLNEQKKEAKAKNVHHNRI